MIRDYHFISQDRARKGDNALVSIIINNFNYGRFLRNAVDSALNQRYPHTEVIVVDDGSTDDSRDIIRSYGSRVIPVFKENGGQASALNAGFSASCGDVILFLDSDDILFPTASSKAASRLDDPAVSKVHWPMLLIDEHGKRTGETQAPPEGDFGQLVIERGPFNIASSPTSGNAWSRSFLKRIMPIPEDIAYYRSCADEYLYTLAPVFGWIASVAEPQSSYRIHGRNVYSGRSFQEKLSLELSGYDEQCEALGKTLARNDVAVDVSSWKQHSWFHRLNRGLQAILNTVPSGERVVLIDGSSWGLGAEYEGRFVRPFIEQDGVDWGAPANDELAVSRLRELLSSGVGFLVIGWPCFWWRNEYRCFYDLLRSDGHCVLRNEDVEIFELSGKTSDAAVTS